MFARTLEIITDNRSLARLIDNNENLHAFFLCFQCHPMLDGIFDLKSYCM